MKKIFFLFMALIILSGCGQNKISEISEKAPLANNSYSEGGAANKTSMAGEVLGVAVKPTEGNTSSAIENARDETGLANQAIIKTNLGNITVKFYTEESPLTVNNFLDLAKKGFYNGTKFHRVIKDFMIQGGDPNSKDDDWSNDGMGGPGYKFNDEFNDHKLVRGSLAMANSGPNTNGSQFFIVTAEFTPWLDGKHTNFGYVASGMDVVDKIETAEANGNSHPLKDITIEGIELLNIQK
jgi:peptidyl-prolyl cis-trans isomerase B (cyclophilin B)